MKFELETSEGSFEITCRKYQFDKKYSTIGSEYEIEVINKSKHPAIFVGDFSWYYVCQNKSELNKKYPQLAASLKDVYNKYYGFV